MQTIGRSSKIATTPPPVLGLNTADPVTAVDPRYARSLLNFFPGEYSLKIREGYIQWITGLPDPVETLMPYVTTDGNQFLFGATDSGIYDVTTSGTFVGLGLTPKVALTYGRVSHVQFTNLAGSFLIVCSDSSDYTFIYDGANWITCTQIIAPAEPDAVGEFSNINPNKFCAVTSHMKRLWFLERDSMSAWYLDLENISGPAYHFPLGSIFKRGGKLTNVFTWSVSSGEGMDDVLLFQTSEGELAAYAGADPTDPNNWQLLASHYISAPLTDRSSVSVGADAYVLSSYGVLSVSDIVNKPNVPLTPDASRSAKISKSIAAELKSRGRGANWEAHIHSTRQSLFVCFPAYVHAPVQYVMNLQTGAWTKYDMPIHTAQMLGETLYFSDNAGNVYKWGDIYKDNVSLDGTTWTNITATFEASYTDLGEAGRNKHFNLVRLLWVSHQHPTYVVGLSLDYFQNRSFYNWAYPAWAEEGDLWDEGQWNDAIWTGAPTARYRWDGVEGLGYSVSLMLRVNTKRYVELVSVDWAYAVGVSL